MRFHHAAAVSKVGKRIILAVGSVLVLACAAGTMLAQDENPKRGSYPGASFALGEIESINTTNGNLLVNIPLASLPPGRGGLAASVRLVYNSKLWEDEPEQFPDCARSEERRVGKECRS